MAGARHRAQDLNLGAYAVGIQVDFCADYDFIGNIRIEPWWDIFANVGYPQTIDTWVQSNRTGIIIQRMDGGVIDGLVDLYGNIGIEFTDGNGGISPENSYGHASNVRFDTVNIGVVSNSTNIPGWQFSNLSVGVAGGGVTNVQTNTGGSQSPIIDVNGGSFWGGIKSVQNGAGSLTLNNVFNAPARGRVATAAAPPTLTGATGVQAVLSTSITIGNPNGAYIRVSGGMSGYCSSVGTTVDQYWQLDGGTWLVSSNQVGHYYFNTAADHRQLGAWETYIGPVGPGTHGVAVNINISAARSIRTVTIGRS